jgi:putative intracellular protease/amidase
MASPRKILLIVTSHEKLGETGDRTGFWLEELAAPYREFVKAGAAVDIASPRGGRRVAGFSNEEEAAVGLTKVVPFSLETKLRELGGHYERGPMWGAFAVRDGRLVTGQNPSSSALVAQETLAALESA